MGVAKPVILKTRTFAKRGDASAFFKEMLNRYSPGDRVSEADGADLAELLKRHPDYAEKVGAGIDYFEIGTDKYDTQCFRIIRLDDTGVNFSYPKCIAPNTKR